MPRQSRKVSGTGIKVNENEQTTLVERSPTAGRTSNGNSDRTIQTALGRSLSRRIRGLDPL